MKSYVKTTRFWLAWTIASLLVYPLVVVFLIAFSIVWTPITEALFPNTLFYGFGPSSYENVYFLVLSGIVGAIVGLGIGLLQSEVIKRFFHINMKHWRRTSVAGGLIAAPVMFLTMTGLSNLINDHYWRLMQTGQYYIFSTALNVMPMVMYVSIMSAVQLLILRRYVKSAWLWILANGVAGLMFSMLVTNAFEPGFGDWLLAAIVQGAVTGFAMLWLLHRLHRETASEDERDYAYQHVPIDTDSDEPRDSSVWDDAV